ASGRTNPRRRSPHRTAVDASPCAHGGRWTRAAGVYWPRARGRSSATRRSRPSLPCVFRSKAEQKVADAGYDPARLPPGQYLTEKWPVLHAGDVPAVDLATWTLSLGGDVEESVTLTY